MTTGFAPVVFDAPLVNPAPNGLWDAVAWQDEQGPLRWLTSGVDVRVFNYGGETQFGVWQADWCVAEADLDPQTDVKLGERPDFPDTFLPLTTWASDRCDTRKVSQDEVRTRAQQVHRLQEPNAVETFLAPRLLADAGTAAAVADIVAAVGALEAAVAKTNTLGVIHAGAQWASPAASKGLIRYLNGKLVTPLGHQWVFGGGYVDGLGDKLVVTSPVFGWRGEVTVQDAPSTHVEEFLAVAERSLVVAYEMAVAAVEVS
ncbi:uncharacterized protein RMCC_5770 [Mycolicibacterium canariasense]|uniref:Gp13 n=1 Tax=Mycolicibacterium canariasense TaxID=228230 RepID=A0A117IC02_MYCCR|nr:hypothetical protein [Mycolicibacterium canariasense]MCV7210158.1 hypothetical protein [Mycolicibacterium canariasense]ORU97864.1 hypothetical protein AWB94_29360 [Mycolicibacterium canariasense]GAS98805.1 uncharacterized protein RMCC_5770 [Mycolicibacterium canariasense]